MRYNYRADFARFALKSGRAIKTPPGPTHRSDINRKRRDPAMADYEMITDDLSR